ncbi:peptidylprolyl isomerase [Lysinibacillus contaminans]|uniref:Peptidyl-prolyl cis-trans isomerase n=1 Tax=Lysinibacillus contaminans TaxID=1293441 RepID=A0ABR5K4M9_9BACI|nr:peptidylprolyl isomerase [Lysinibacillus contaminans]
MTGCGTSTESGQSGDKAVKESDGKTDYSSDVKENPIVTITMKNDEKIVIELEPTIAPNTVANFVSLVEEGFYDGLIFHRVIPGFMIQGGDPSGNGSGGPGYAIEGEFSNNGFENNLKHERGVISMARTGEPNSAGSQFFIMVEEAVSLNGEYAAFGKVIEGMETVDAIVAAERDGADKPLEDQQMKKVEVDTKGFDYPAPVVQK